MKELEELKEKLRSSEEIDYDEVLRKLGNFIQNMAKPGKIKITIEGLPEDEFNSTDIKEGVPFVREGVKEFFLIARDKSNICALGHCGKALKIEAMKHLSD